MYDRADDVTEGKIVSVFVGLFKYLPILHHSLPQLRSGTKRTANLCLRWLKSVGCCSGETLATRYVPPTFERRDTSRVKDGSSYNNRIQYSNLDATNHGLSTASTNARDGFNTWSRICLWIAYLKSCWFDWTRDRSSTNFSRRDLLRDAIVPSSFAWTNRGKKSTIEISRKYLGRPAPGKISPGRSMIWIISREFDRPTFSPSVEQRKYFEYR